MQHPVRVDKIKKHRKKDPPAYQRKRPPAGGRVTRGEHDPRGHDEVGAPEVVGRYPVERVGGASSTRPRDWPPQHSLPFIRKRRRRRPG